MKNIENIKLVLKKIEENPECWNQENWHCGTAHCFAGHAQIESGHYSNNKMTRHDARVFFGFSSREADYYFAARRTLKELRTSTKDFYDKHGFGRDGYDRGGYDCNGYNSNGLGHDGRNRNGRDRDGLDREGYDADGLDIDNNSKSQ